MERQLGARNRPARSTHTRQCGSLLVLHFYQSPWPHKPRGILWAIWTIRGEDAGSRQGFFFPVDCPKNHHTGVDVTCINPSAQPLRTAPRNPVRGGSLRRTGFFYVDLFAGLVAGRYLPAGRLPFARPLDAIQGNGPNSGKSWGLSRGGNAEQLA
jgi:hypothetical protein